MTKTIDRRTVDLSGYPDLVVIYLGMRVNSLSGLKTMLGLGPRITHAVDQQPDGLLLHENLIFSLFPPHSGMRQYWRDFDALERWARSEPHRQWWSQYVRNSGGTGFWHEAYFMRGGMEGMYGAMVQRTGFMKFAPIVPARASMFSARDRAHVRGVVTTAAPLTEGDLYHD
jgi:hypothetical protein